MIQIKVMKYILVLFTVICLSSCRKDTKDPYPYTFHSIKNYDDTAVEKLAKYVKKNDTIAIVEFIKNNPNISIDTKDKYFGSSLLMFAIFNCKYEAFHCLLNHGADPNLISDYRKRTPLYFAATYCGPQYERDARYCKELLEKGANPNCGYIIHEAVERDLEYVKLLIEYGADFNTKYYGRSPADDAIIQVQPEIAEFLIIGNKAKLYNSPFWKSWEGYEDSKFASSLASSRKRIINYLKEHPEQMMYHKTKMNTKDSIQ